MCPFFNIDFFQPPRPKPRKSTQPTKPTDHYRLNLGNIPFVVGQVCINTTMMFIFIAIALGSRSIVLALRNVLGEFLVRDKKITRD